MAVVFDASADMLSRTANLPSPTAFTFCAWIRRTSDLNNWGCLCALTTAGFGNYLVFTLNADGTTITINTPADEATLLDTTANTWYFVACTNSGSSGGTFVGYLRALTATSFTTASTIGRTFSAAQIQIGANDYGEYFPGDMANVMVFDRVLTSAELMELSQRLRPVDPTSINFWWPLWSPSYTEDWSGNGRAPTVGGTLTAADGPPVSYGAQLLYVNKAAAGGGGTSVTLEPFAGTVSWSGQLATVKTRVNLAPSIANVAWNGQLATLKTRVNLGPLVGNVAWNGQVATLTTRVSVTLQPSIGNVAWNGGVPTYSYQRTTLTPPAGTITWSGGLPTTKTLQRISPLVGNIAWNGQLATLVTRVSVTLQPVAGTISWNGGLATQRLRINVSPAAGVVSWAGNTPTVSLAAGFEWTPVARSTSTWTKISRNTAAWARIDRPATTWVKRQSPYDEEA